MAAPSHRVERVSSVLRETLASLIAFELKDPRVAGVTVTDVEVTGDLSLAKVFLAIPGEAGTEGRKQREKEILRGLDSAAGFLRREIGNRVQMRTVPQLSFRIDPSVDYGARIDSALRGLGMTGAGAGPIPQEPTGSSEDEGDDPA